MLVVEDVSSLRVKLDEIPPETTVGFVPTMGGLHAGHLALVDASVAGCDKTVVSIFVNPAQFAPGEDLAAYPRTLDADLSHLRAAGVDMVFTPPPAAVYPSDFCTYVTSAVGDAATNAASEGASRPTFFRGVATVVAKLLVLVRPTCTYFGRKDAQQCAVVRRMVEDLWIGLTTRVVLVDTVREQDGLAMSSRNVYLAPQEREHASVLYRALCAGREAVDGGERDSDVVRERIRRIVAEWEATSKPPGVSFELMYVSICSADDMREVKGNIREDSGEVLACIAALMGKARLIDNVLLL